MTRQLTPASDHEYGAAACPDGGTHGCSDSASDSASDGASDGTVRVLCTARPSTEQLRAWDRLVGEQPGSDVAQLPAWANLRAEQAGFTPRYLLARQGGQLAGGALVLLRRVPVLGTVGYLPYGPVIAAGRQREPLVRALVDALHRLGARELSGLFVQPPAGAEDVTEGLSALGFRPSVAGIAPVASLEIDLTRDLETIRGGFTRSNRRRTQTANQRGITVRLGDEDDLPLVTDLLASTAAHQHFDPMSLDYLRTLYRELAPEGRVRIFVAELDGEAVATEVFTGCGGVLKSRLTGMRRNDRVRRSGVTAVLIWQALVWAKANGYHTFDFGGVTTETADALEAGDTSGLGGPAAFKASFGGTVVRYPAAVELVASRLLRVGYDFSRRSRLGHPLVVAAKQFLRGGANPAGRGAQSGSSSR